MLDQKLRILRNNYKKYKKAEKNYQTNWWDKFEGTLNFPISSDEFSKLMILESKRKIKERKICEEYELCMFNFTQSFFSIRDEIKKGKTKEECKKINTFFGNPKNNISNELKHSNNEIIRGVLITKYSVNKLTGEEKMISNDMMTSRNANEQTGLMNMYKDREGKIHIISELFFEMLSDLKDSLKKQGIIF
jgi:hypothetical protein